MWPLSSDRLSPAVASHNRAALSYDHHQVAHKKALAWLGHSSSDILDLYYHLHDDDSQQAMQALAMTTGGAGAASQQPLKTGNVRKTGGAPKAGSWVSFGTQAPSAAEEAPQTTENTAVMEQRSNQAERGGFSRREIRKLLDELELCLNCLSRDDLAPLRTLLVAYQFLPS